MRRPGPGEHDGDEDQQQTRARERNDPHDERREEAGDRPRSQWRIADAAAGRDDERETV
jgi:hypothetical protein